MSYPINKQINPNQQQQFASGINTPQLQDINAETIKQNSVLKGVGIGEKNEKGETPGWVTPALTLPVGAGMIYGMDKFNKTCAGTYDESIIGKVSKWGERIGEKVPWLDTIFEKIGSGVTSFKTKVVPKSKLLSAFFNVPTVPKNSMVLMMAGGTKSEVATDAVQRMEEFLKEGGKLVGTDADEVEKLHKIAHTTEGIKRVMEICEQQDKQLAFKSKRFLGIPWSAKFAKNGEKKYLSDFIPSLNKINREVYFSEYANKIKAFIAPEGKTVIGKNISKVMLRTIEGITNGTAGGKIAVLMAAYFVADAIKKTIDAPNKNGEKRKTFAENFISNIGWYVTMPISVMAMHHFGGFQYLGMGKGEQIKENVAKYRDKLEAFNKGAKAGLLSKEAHKAGRKDLIDMIKGDTKLALKNDSVGKTTLKSITNILLKPLKLAARTITIGLSPIRPYLGKDINPAWAFIKKSYYHFKVGAGYPMRFLLFAMVTAPFFGNWFARGSHVIFGRPSKSILDKEEDEKPKEPSQVQAVQAQPVVQASAAVPPSSQPVATAGQPVQVQSAPAAIATAGPAVQAQAPMRVTIQQKPSPTPNRNIIMGQPAQNHYLPPKPIVPTRPAQYSLNAAKTEPTAPRKMMAKDPARSYIPSSEPVRVNQQQQVDPQLQNVLGQSYAAERAASRFIG